MCFSFRTTGIPAIDDPYIPSPEKTSPGPRQGAGLA
jgi:hypothetical protein